MPSGAYIALFGATPTDDGVLASELATTIASQYSRTRAYFTATTTDGYAANATDVVFPTAANAWPTLVAIGITDGATQRGGSLIWWGGLTTVQTVLVNQRAKVAQNDLSVTLDG